jgi:hypothetical protein
MTEGCLTDRRISYLKELKYMKVSKNFVLQEFINPDTYKAKGEQSLYLIDKKLIDIAQFLRDDIGKPVTINDWHTGGDFKESGLRDVNTSTGSPRSMHKSGKAIDVKVKGMTGEQWYQYVKKNAKKLYELGLRRIEDRKIATSWCHMDTKDHGQPNVIQVIDLKEVVERIKIVGL